jgi:nicotinamidase-related amidase
VAYFLHTDDDAGFRQTDPEFRLIAGLDPHAGEPVFVKRTRNCFTSTPLLPWLLERGVGRVAICGIQTEQCCETTARLGADLGFAVDFVTEATLTFPIPNLDRPGEELGTAAIRERTEYALRGRFARIATVAAVVAELRTARWPNAA